MVYLLLANGFEEAEALVAADLLRRAEVEVKLVGLDSLTVTGAHGITVTADCLLTDTEEAAEMVILPGGMGGVNNIMADPDALVLVRSIARQGGYVAAICAAPTILVHLGLLDGREAVVYPGMEDEMGSAVVKKGQPVVCDGKCITAEAAGSAFEFGLKLAEVLKGADAAKRVKESVYYRH